MLYTLTGGPVKWKTPLPIRAKFPVGSIPQQLEPEIGIKNLLNMIMKTN